MRRFYPLIFCALAITNAAWAAAPPASWVLSYEGQSSNAFIWDKRSAQLVKNSVPRKMADDLLSALGGPPDPFLVLERRYVRASACVPHACMVKGFFWFDSQRGVGVGAYLFDDTLTLGSSALTQNQVPALARQAIKTWLSEQELQPKQIAYLAPNGRRSALAAEQYLSASQYRPAPEGPSFDCARAATAIETTICSDAQLARQDLELAILVKEIRHGNSTVGGRDQLRAFQRDWLKGRDAACKEAPAMVQCLSEQYRQQQQRLGRWVPKP